MSTVQPNPSGGNPEPREKPRGALKFDAARPELIPADLRGLPQFCTWRYEDNGGKAGEAPKPTKVPYRPNGVGKADKTDPADLGTLQECVDGLKASWATTKTLDGVGFSFLNGNGWAGLDFDEVTSVDGAASAELRDLLAHLKGVACYLERSPSGTGVKAIMRVDTDAVRRGLEAIRPSAPRESMKMACARPGIKEVQAFYGGGYFTLTGVHWEPEANPSWTGEAFEDATEAFLAVVQAAHALKFRNTKPKASKNHEPPLRLAVNLTDDEVLALAFKAKNGDAVRALYEGSDASHGDDASAGDCALAAHLAFYCGPNGHAQVASIMRASPRNRDKFERADYMASTLAKAYDGRTDYYDPSRRRTQPSAPKATASSSADDVNEFVLAYGFRERYHGTLIHTDQDRWFILDPATGILREDTLGAVLGLAMDFTNHTLDTALDGERERTRLKKIQVAHAVLRGARSSALSDGGFGLKHEHLDRDPWLLGTPSGVLNLHTGELRLGTVADLVTKTTRVSPADRADESTCPEWLRFVNFICGGNREVVQFLQRFFGYCLTGDLSDHAILWLYGPGGTGKSTAMELLSYVLGDYAVPMSPKVLIGGEDQHGTHTASLLGARLALCSEFPEGQRLNEARLKRLSGGDKMRANFMRQDEFSFENTAKLVSGTNHKPRLVDVSDAMARRLHLVEFKHKLDAGGFRDRVRGDLKHHFKEHEAAGILRWCIDGLNALLANRANGGGLNPPRSVVTATSEYLAAQDTRNSWWDDHFMYRDSDAKARKNFMPTSEILASWNEWAEANGVQQHFDSIGLGEFMHTKNGAQADSGRVNGKRQRGYFGVVKIMPMADNEGCSDE